MSGFPFTPVISFICSFFILSILDFLSDLLSTSVSVDKILFIFLVEIYHTSAPILHVYFENDPALQSSHGLIPIIKFIKLDTPTFPVWNHIEKIQTHKVNIAALRHVSRNNFGQLILKEV